MRKIGSVLRCAVAAALLVTALAAGAQVKLASVFGDNMVLQRGMKVPIWGVAQPGEKVEVAFEGSKAAATADKDGKWQVKLGPFKPGGPYEMSVKAQSGEVKVSNVLVGDVWVASGQSNMEFAVGGAKNAAEEIANATYPSIRLFHVQNAVAEKPLTEVKATWEACTPQSVPGFSAVAYFFGRELHKRLDVPIGLIESNWGGTPAESWTALKYLESDPILTPMLSRIPKPGEDTSAAQRDYEKKLAEWQAVAFFKDPGNKGVEDGWAKPDFDDSGWKSVTLPGQMEKLDPDLAIDGAVWFRKSVTVPEEWAGKDLSLDLGPIDDFDVTYFNGEKVGGIGDENPNAYAIPRKYAVPGALVKAGENFIAVRVFDRGGGGGLTGSPDDTVLAPAGPGIAGQIVKLAGPWKFKIEVSRLEKDIPPQPQPPAAAWNSWTPTGLYNAMIAPLIPYGIKGAIWYQGESNADRAFQYRTLFATMIKCWRAEWGEGDFPFFWVQLANFTAHVPQPAESDWAELREAQTMTLALKKTGQAVITDVGDADNIHPTDKQTVGLRLALTALNVAYGDRSFVGGSPLYKSMKVQGSKIVLSFTNVGAGLVAKDGGPLAGFAIAGEDKKFVWADAKIVGNTVVVSSDQVAQPVAVRYAWANNPDCTLYNKEGQPASPFRTDTWPGTTDKNR